MTVNMNMNGQQTGSAADVLLDPVRIEFRDHFRRFVARRLESQSVRGEREIPRDVHLALAEGGFLAPDYPEDLGGGGGAIGAASCQVLAGAGAIFACLDLALDAANSVAHGITHSGDSALALACDVASEASVNAAVGEVVSRTGWPADACALRGHAGQDRKNYRLQSDRMERDHRHGIPVERDGFVIARRLLKEHNIDLSVLEEQELPKS